MLAYELDPGGIDPLLALRESGPGYQVIQLPSGDIKTPAGEYLVFNADLLIKFDDFVQFLTGQDPQNPPRSFDTYGAFKVSIVPAPTKISQLPSLPILPSTTPATPTPWPLSPTLVATSVTSGNEVFWRLSAVNPDPRIRGGHLLPGSYLISDDDLKMVNTGFGAVGRYALPNPFPARHLFEFHPPAGETFYIGTTRPNFGQAGGGVELFFQAIKSPISGAYHKGIPGW